MIRIFIFLVAAMAATSTCCAQDIPVQPDTTVLWRIGTNDDNEFIGKIKEVRPDVVIVQTVKFGVVTIRKVDIKSIEEADPRKVVGTDYWSDNFQSTRYFWMPNGYGLKAGEAYYQNVWVLFNQFSVGISDHVSLGVGTIPIFLFGADAAPVWVTPKVSIPISEKVHLGAGVLYLFILGEGTDGGGVAYGSLTFGSRNKNASLGVGYGFTKGNFSRRPVISFATMTRIGPRGYVMTENYLFGAGDGDAASFGLISIGGRRLMKKVGLDFGGFIPVGGGLDRLIVIPWLGLSVPLGKQRRSDD